MVMSAISSASVEEAENSSERIDIAVLDYHLGAGKFGTEVAQSLRDKRPEVPIIISFRHAWNESSAAWKTCTCSKAIAQSMTFWRAAVL